jgi:hypothetical protein
MKRVLYLQYTNPAGYPPLEHSSGILADSGWDAFAPVRAEPKCCDCQSTQKFECGR